MTTPVNIEAFIRERLEEDRRQAQAALDDEFQRIFFDTGNIDLAECHEKHGPHRVLRDVETDLALLHEHDEEGCPVCLDDPQGCPTYRALAYRHSSHPEWQWHWVPDGHRGEQP
jgi:hypothetical protein